MTTLQRQIEETNDLFDKQEAELRDMRKRAVAKLWEVHIKNGLLKSELETNL